MNNTTVLDTTVARLLAKGFYSTAFQPILDTRSDQVHGFEGLLRGPEGTPLNTPDLVFNGTGTLSPEVRTELDLACIYSTIRNARHLPVRSHIFINVRGETLVRLADALDGFLGLLSELGIAPDRIVFEISETTDQSRTDGLVPILETLRTRGIWIALDDVGIRYPYFYHLLCLEPDFIKLDRTFVHGVDTDVRKQTLIGCLAFLAKQMGAELITEGVETQDEFTALKDLGVPLMQGYHIGRPFKAEHWSNTQVQAELPGAVQTNF